MRPRRQKGPNASQRRFRNGLGHLTAGPAHPRNTPDGFTLLELVIAVTILSIMMTVGYRAVSQMTRGKTLLDDERDMSMIANAVLGRVVRELQHTSKNGRIFPPANNLKGARGRTALRGESKSINHGKDGDTISFVASDAGQYVPDGKSHAGMVQISYRVEENPEGSEEDGNQFLLIRDEVPDLQPLKRAYEQRMTFPITDRVTSLTFRYFDGNDWVDKWDELQTKLPELVSFSVGLRSPRGKEQTYSTIIILFGDE